MKDVIPVYGVKTRRLAYGVAAQYEGGAPLNRVDVCSQNLVERIARIKSEEDRPAIELNNTFPERLLAYARPLPQVFLRNGLKDYP
jgi:hypothetical protein